MWRSNDRAGKAGPIKALVVGGDGVIGAKLARSLAEDECVVSMTSRRDGGGCCIPFDLVGGGRERLLELRPDIVVICAAMTNMQACETNVDISFRVNVTETVALAEAMLAQGAFVVFLSSNTVFDGQTPWPGEYVPYNPTVEYGRQKARAEELLAALPTADRNFATVRLSKVISSESGLAHQFLAKLQSSEICHAFSDLLLCPVSLAYVTHGLSVIARARRAGIFHLSGATELSYAAFADAIAVRIGVDRSFVQPVESIAAGVDVLFRPRYPGLGMGVTTEYFGITPEPLDQVIESLLSKAI